MCHGLFSFSRLFTSFPPPTLIILFEGWELKGSWCYLWFVLAVEYPIAAACGCALWSLQNAPIHLMTWWCAVCWPVLLTSQGKLFGFPLIPGSGSIFPVVSAEVGGGRGGVWPGWAGWAVGGMSSGRGEETLLGRGSNLYPMDLGEIQHLIQE